jgi:hypothetical protein
MFELLSLLGGGVLRLVPFIVDFFKQRREAEHEYRMTELQLRIDQARAAQQIDLAHAQAGIAAAAGELAVFADAVKAQGQPSGVVWVDALSASVRPVLTYYWTVGLYGGAKVIGVIVAVQANTALAGYGPILVSEFDRAVIGSMLSFWFVDRALRKLQ